MILEKGKTNNKGVKGRCKILAITWKQLHITNQIQHTGSKFRNKLEDTALREKS